ncbi:MAG: ribonucleoside-diphosphate reductase subunit alpha [Aquificaceae bacterium]|nr:ribonucleoside-diphosphate reductase subunit alpha [Aquificaceae bacterium]
MHVRKRSGEKEALDISKIRLAIGFACKDIDVDPMELELDAQIQFRDGISTKEIQQLLIRTAAEKVSPQTPQWQYVAARLLLYDLYKEVGHIRGYEVKDKINGKYKPYNPDSFHKLVETYAGRGIYGEYLLKEYTEQDFSQLAHYIEPERDLLFNYTGIKVLADRYLVRDEEGSIVELPQEMYMLIAMTLAIPEEKEKRLHYAKLFYDLMSSHQVSLATPTLMNARRTHTQLSSCFVLTVEDDLYDIFDNVQKAGQISKFAGGLGVYLGKIRATGAPIRKFKGASSGVLPVVKILNDVMVYVDQLGMRKGSASITLDIWHKDVLDFLEVKTNVGDERKKAHDIHPAVAIPDLFMKRLKNRQRWTLFDPYYCKKVKGDKNLEDFYGEEFEELYERLERELPPYAKKEVDAFELWKRLLSVIFETGEPYVFFRDTANRLNPNKHCGMVYSSNLCHEIVQNMSPSQHVEESLSEEGVILHKKKSGDVVVCNLGSINLGKVYTKEEMEKVVPLLVRMLDNVISMNYYAVKEAQWTNWRYRSIGIGVSNYHYRLVKEGISWESEEHLQFAQALFERIAYYAIKGSMELAKERGAYPLFEGSDWSKGIFFGRTPGENVKLSKNGFDWVGLAQEVKTYGMRNAYLIAVMPTGSTSLILGATPSVDPIFAKFYKEENMSGVLPQVPPEIDKLFWHYKSAYHIDQEWVIRAAAARQLWIDQAQSLNLFIDPEKIDGPTLSKLYELARELGLKTVYYTRSKSMTDIEECESCST